MHAYYWFRATKREAKKKKIGSTEKVAVIEKSPVGTYESTSSNRFHSAFSDKSDSYEWELATLVIKKDSTYLFETEEMVSKGFWKMVEKDDGDYLKFVCLLSVDVFDGKIWNPRIDSCKKDIPLLFYNNDEILYPQHNESLGEYFEFVKRQ